jgi:RNA polymerase sigma-70 factor (ECF subfamily)
LGDTGAFSALVIRHQPRALALATSLVRDENDASEIVQEAFLRAYRNLHRFAGDSSFFTWLYRIVSNLCIDFLRRPQRRDGECIDPLLADECGELMVNLESSQSPFDELVNKELQQNIARCLRRLPPYHRGVIEMRELRGMSYEEMARAMGVSKGTIMSRLFHARQKLQRSLRECHQLPR